MIEKIVRFGDKKSLIGVVTEPVDKNKSKPAFIFVNSGLIHRIGPFRAYVWASRELTNIGFTAMRMDLSGKGESPARRGGGSHKENVIQDLNQAMDFLQESRGIEHFVICGICTGADNSYVGGFNDERVMGIVPIDGYAYRTFGYYKNHYAPRIFNMDTWCRFFKRKLGLGAKQPLQMEDSRAKNSQAKSDKLKDEQPTYEPKFRMMFPPKQEFVENMQRVLERGTKLLIIYTGGWAMFYNYERQFKDAFPKLAEAPGVEVSFNPRSDHTFILKHDRQNLINLLCDWAKRNFS